MEPPITQWLLIFTHVRGQSFFIRLVQFIQGTLPSRYNHIHMVGFDGYIEQWVCVDWNLNGLHVLILKPEQISRLLRACRKQEGAILQCPISNVHWKFPVTPLYCVSIAKFLIGYKSFNPFQTPWGFYKTLVKKGYKYFYKPKVR